MVKYYQLEKIGTTGFLEVKKYKTKASALKSFKSMKVPKDGNIYLEQRDTEFPHKGKRIAWNSSKYGLKIN